MKFETVVKIFLMGLMATYFTVHGAWAEESSPKKSVLESLKLIQGDEKGNEIKSLKTELLVSSSESKAIAQAKKLIRKYRGTRLEPDLQFRLAELYMRKSKTDTFFEIHRESETIVKLAPRVATRASSKRTVRYAVQRYAYIQKRFPHFDRMDLVIFNHAFAEQILGQDGPAKNLYGSLISRFPNSRLVPDAHLAIGEIAFHDGKFKLALEHFNAIQKYPDSKVYPYGLYKAAWTYYNLRDARAGIKKLEEVVAYGKHVAENHIESRLDLRQEALADMTLFYEDVFPPERAFAYFQKQAGELDIAPIIMKLARLYERHARYNDLRVVLGQMIDELPESSLVPQAMDRMIYAFDNSKKRDQAVDQMKKLAEICQPDSDWSKTKDNVTKDCNQILSEVSLHMAKKWLKTWKRNPKATTFADHSEKAFEIYLAVAPKTDDYASAKYLYADLLFKRQKYRRASQEYASLGSSPGKLGHDASYAAVLSLEKAVGDKWDAADEKSFHQLAEDYVKNHPKGKYRLDVEYKMALLDYNDGRYDQAAPRFLRLGQTFAKEDKGRKSQDLYLDIMNIKKDYDGIRKYAKGLIKKGGSAARVAKLQKIYEQAYFLEVQKIEEKGDLKEALHQYLDFVKHNPSSALAQKAEWNSIQLFFKTHDSLGGARACEKFANDYPKAKEATDALLRAAQTYESMAQLGPATRVLTLLSERDAKSKTKWLELAADFYALSGQPTMAMKTYNDLMLMVPHKDQDRILLKEESLEKTYGSESAQAKVLKQIIHRGVQPNANQAKIEYVENLYDQKKYTEAFNESKRLLGSSSFSRQEKSQVRFVQARILEHEFVKQSVKSQASRVAMVLALKTEKLEKAQTAFQSAIRYGDPKVAVQSMEHLYHCYEDYVTSLKTMPTPAGLSGKDADAFRGEIQNLIIPLEEKGVDTLAQAVKFAKKHEFVDGTVTRLEQELARVNKQSIVFTNTKIETPKMIVPALGGGAKI